MHSTRDEQSGAVLPRSHPQIPLRLLTQGFFIFLLVLSLFLLYFLFVSFDLFSHLIAHHQSWPRQPWTSFWFWYYWTVFTQKRVPSHPFTKCCFFSGSSSSGGDRCIPRSALRRSVQWAPAWMSFVLVICILFYAFFAFFWFCFWLSFFRLFEAAEAVCASSSKQQRNISAKQLHFYPINMLYNCSLLSILYRASDFRWKSRCIILISEYKRINETFRLALIALFGIISASKYYYLWEISEQTIHHILRQFQLYTLYSMKSVFQKFVVEWSLTNIIKVFLFTISNCYYFSGDIISYRSCTLN